MQFSFLTLKISKKKLFLENIPPFPDFSKIPLIEKIIHIYIIHQPLPFFNSNRNICGSFVAKFFSETT